MSTFSGKIDECSWIWIDRFEDINSEPAVCFLSHCHQDHMSGLDNDEFYTRLKTKKCQFYCHNVTKILLESDKRYSRVAELAITKDYNEVFSVSPVSEYKCESAPVNITFLDAQHCPGSVMILLEFSNGDTSLYTGDFRLLRNDWYSYTPLRDPCASTGFKSIKTLYFDSTFCRKGTIDIPTKEQSTNLFLKMVSEWLGMNPGNKVLIWGTCYGQEFLLRAVWEKLGLQCHVSADKYRIYSKLPEYAQCVTWAANSTRVHACTTGVSAMDECYVERKQLMVKSKCKKYKPHIFPCGLCRPDNKMVRVIRPSVIWFARRSEKNVVGYDHNYFCRLLYSNHCSFSEIVDSFKVLRPLRAFPNVLDKKFGLEHAEKIMKYLKKFLHESETDMNSKGDIKRDLELSYPLKKEYPETGADGMNATLLERIVKVESERNNASCKKTDLTEDNHHFTSLQDDVIVIDDDDDSY